MTTRNYTKMLNGLSDAQKRALDHLAIIGGDIEAKSMSSWDGKVSDYSMRRTWNARAGYNVYECLKDISGTTWVALANKGLLTGERKAGEYRRWTHTQEKDKMKELHLTPLGLRLGDMQHQKSSVYNWSWRVRKLINRLYLIDQVVKDEWTFTDPESELAALLVLRDHVKVTMDHPYDPETRGSDYSQFTLTLGFKYHIQITQSRPPYMGAYDQPGDPRMVKREQYVDYIATHGIYHVTVSDKDNPLYAGYGDTVVSSALVLDYAQELIEAQRVCSLVNRMSDHTTGVIKAQW